MAQAASRTETDTNGNGDRPRDRDVPDQPTDLPKEAFPAILKRTFKQFGEDQLTTWAAALTYFGVLSLFPMLLAMVSILGVIGPSATQPLLDNLSSRRARPGQGHPHERPHQPRVQPGWVDGRADHRHRARDLVGLGLHQRVHGRLQQRLGRARGAADLEEDPGPSRRHRGPARPAHDHRAGRRLHRPDRAEGRRHHRPRQHVRRRLEHREVAGPAADRLLHDLAALLGVPERQAAGLPVGDARRPVRRRPLARSLRRCSRSTSRTSPPTTRPTAHSAA